MAQFRGRNQKRTITMDDKLEKAKFEEAIQILKDDYMFMHVFEDVLYFKNANTKQYVKIERNSSNG